MRTETHISTHCTIKVGNDDCVGLVIADLDWHEDEPDVGIFRGYGISNARLVDFPLLGDNLNAMAADIYGEDRTSGIVDLEITIEIEGIPARTCLDGTMIAGMLQSYTLDLIGYDIETLLDHVFNSDI